MKNIKYKIISKIIIIFYIAILSLLSSGFISNFIVSVLSQREEDILNIQAFLVSIRTDKVHLNLFFLLFILFFCLLAMLSFFRRNVKHTKTEMISLTPRIEIPRPSGQKQHGSSWFTTEKEQSKYFKEVIIDKDDDLISEIISQGENDIFGVTEVTQDDSTNNIEQTNKEIKLIKNRSYLSGIPVGYTKKNNMEIIKVINGDFHSVIFGATRSGKSRTLVIQSIVLSVLAGDDMITSDPKGELYQYTYPFLKRMGYEDLAIDFKNPKRSIKYNFLQFIINAVEENDKSKMISVTWDFVDSLVKTSKNADPLWSNGEKSILAAGVLQVVYDNSKIGLKAQYPDISEEEIIELYETKHKYYQNCLNVFNYISKMSLIKPGTKKMYLSHIITALPDNHPSKLILAISEAAPDRVRGSFITSALATLRLFTDPNIADMTSSTDDRILNLDIKKAIFIILPDNRQTFFQLSSIFVNQYYQYITDYADTLGGRLKRDFKFNLDEFGNFSAIPFFDGKITVAAGRGVHFNLYLQSKDQIVDKYGKELASIILDNCHYWIYLKSTGDTVQMLEKAVGKYTVLSTSSSSSLNHSNSISIAGSSSTSSNLMARPLLFAKEIESIERPYILVLVDGTTNLLKIPDLSKWSFNKILGLGTPEHNVKVRLYRENTREERIIGDISLWDFVGYVDLLIENSNSEILGEYFSSAFEEDNGESPEDSFSM